MSLFDRAGVQPERENRAHFHICSILSLILHQIRPQKFPNRDKFSFTSTNLERTFASFLLGPHASRTGQVRLDRPPLTAHRSPLTAHRSPLTAHRSRAFSSVKKRNRLRQKSVLFFLLFFGSPTRFVDFNDLRLVHSAAATAATDATAATAGR